MEERAAVQQWEGKCLLDLDDDVLRHMWNFLTKRERLRSRLVCRRFSVIGGDSIRSAPSFLPVWKKFDVAVSRAFPRLPEFNYINSCSELENIISALEERIVYVKMIGLSNNVSDVFADFPADLLKRFHSLEILLLQCCGYEAIEWFIGHGPKLTHLTLHEVPQEFIDALPRLFNLQKFSFACQDHIVDGVVMGLAQNCPRLREFALLPFGVELSPTSPSTDALSCLFTSCPKIEVLSGVPYSNPALIRSIHRMPNLRSLNSNECQITELCTLVMHGFQSHEISVRVDFPLTIEEIAILQRCSGNVIDLNIRCPFPQQPVVLKQFASIFGKSLTSLSCYGFENIEIRQCLNEFPSLQSLHGLKFSRPLLNLINLRQLSVSLEDEKPGTLMEIGLRLKNLKYLELWSFEAFVWGEIKDFCKRPRFLLGLDELRLPFICKTGGARADVLPLEITNRTGEVNVLLRKWCNKLILLAQKYRPCLLVKIS